MFSYVTYQFTYFPRMYSFAIRTKTHIFGWESMNNQDLTCTPPIPPTGDFLKIHSSYSIFNSFVTYQFTCFPGVYSSTVWTKTHIFRWESMDNQDLSCTTPVPPTGDFEKSTIAIHGFICDIFPGVYICAIWTKIQIFGWE